ncbi:MAG: hypothetical protein WC791_03485 [Candidatus Paceibacterota bacterium]|jgi:hypothetical protein
MYVLIRINSDTILQKVRKYLALLGLWVKEFNDPEYRVDVSAEERAQVIHSRGCRGSLNPNRAWESCASFVQVWDWDNLGRIWPKHETDLKKKGDTAPQGKGWIIEGDKKVRVAGDCGNPTGLSDIYCPKWCEKYEPINTTAAIFVAEQVIEEHERRAKMLRAQIERLKQIDLQYREVIKTGGIFEYKDGKFIISTPDK